MKSLVSIILEILNNRKFQKAVIAIALSCLVYFILPVTAGEPARRMAFIFVFAALFWALEIVPLYTTSLLVVLLEVFLLCRPGGVLGMDKGGYKVFLLPFGSPIIMLFFGGLTMAAALRKYKIDNLIACHLLKHFGSKPYSIMLGFMFTTAFLSMWMSNTATTAMMIAMILPIVTQLKKNAPFKKALILSIPFAANIGGIGTPIGTPPNAIALGILADHNIYLNFISWMIMAVPLVFFLLILTSMLLMLFYNPKVKHVDLNLEKQGKLGRKAQVVITVSVATVLLWLTSPLHHIPSAVIALLAAGIFFSLHLLSQEDLKSIDWDVLVLMWGGLALGKGMGLTGLTKWILSLSILTQQGTVLVIVFCILALILSTFMSNTATANLLIPIVMAIPGESHILLAISVALSCSFAMAFPISTPPNAIAFSTGMISMKDMMRIGAVVSIVSVATILIGFKFIITRVFGL